MAELCLKDEVVLTLKNIEGKPSEIIKVNNPELLPTALQQNINNEIFFKWLYKRCIPENREGFKEVKDKFGDKWLEQNIHYLSLSDHYWLRKRNEKYKNINFFTNRYPLECGNLFFSPWCVNTRSIQESPDFTTGGLLKKRWRQYEGNNTNSYLLKAGSQAARQEPLSEVLVSILCERLKVVDCVKYELATEGMVMCSKCDNFVTFDTDYVPAEFIYHAEPKKDGESVYDHLIRMCEKFDIPGAQEHIDWTIFIDNITGNEDRNLGNIGFIRNIKTMKFLKCAPIFDSGNAYWNSKNVIEGVSRSKLFGDVEKRIYQKMFNKCDLSVLNNKDYVDIVAKYPEITDVKKEKLIEAISKKNSFLLIESREQEER